jgi:hypothetical protein
MLVSVGVVGLVGVATNFPSTILKKEALRRSSFCGQLSLPISSRILNSSFFVAYKTQHS